MRRARLQAARLRGWRAGEAASHLRPRPVPASGCVGSGGASGSSRPPCSRAWVPAEAHGPQSHPEAASFLLARSSAGEKEGPQGPIYRPRMHPCPTPVGSEARSAARSTPVSLKSHWLGLAQAERTPQRRSPGGLAAQAQRTSPLMAEGCRASLDLRCQQRGVRQRKAQPRPLGTCRKGERAPRGLTRLLEHVVDQRPPLDLALFLLLVNLQALTPEALLARLPLAGTVGPCTRRHLQQDRSLSGKPFPAGERLQGGGVPTSPKRLGKAPSDVCGSLGGWTGTNRGAIA
mmetsp:Transcript_10148/g.24176  ORF Transcript_10148/g.24176 Transcript_10148/m.24176 type:complete len:289 (+) Transcript_10148:392-1258(+)